MGGKIKRRRGVMVSAVVAATAINFFSNSAHADTTATWTGTNGDWADPTQWSTNPNYPNNGTPSGIDYQALINGASTRSISLDEDVALDALTLNDRNATLTQTAGTLSVGTVSITNGTYLLNGGTIANTTISASTLGKMQLNGGTIANSTINLSHPFLIFNGGTLNGVSVTNGDLYAEDLVSPIYIQNGITMNGQNLNLAGDVYFDGASQSIDNLNIIGNGTIHPSGPTSIGPQTLTLGPNTTVSGTTSFVNNVPGDSLINNGTIDADTSGGLLIQEDNFTNNGTVESTNDGIPGDSVFVSITSANWTNSSTGVISADASTIVLGGKWSNAGTISATDNSVIDLVGDVPAQMGNFEVDSTSTVAITGTVTNTSATLAFSGAGSFTIGNGNGAPGTVIGGIIDNSSGNFSVTNGTLDGVHITGGNLIVGENPIGMPTSLTIQNGLTIDDDNLDLENGSSLYFDDPNPTIDNLNITNGAGNSSCTIYPATTYTLDSETLTLGSHVTVHDGVTFSNSYFGEAQDTLINDGTIGITVGVSNFINNGTIALHNGTISIWSNGGELDVGDGTLTGSGTINGNVVLASDPSTLKFQLRSDSDYDSLTINGDMTLAGNLELDLANGFLPSSLDIFTVLEDSDDSLTGSFLNVADGGTLETDDGSGYFTVYYNDAEYPNEIALTDFQANSSVPEPASAGLLLAGSVALLVRRRRNH